MTGLDFQKALDGIVRDLQTNGKGRTVQILLRGANNSQAVFELTANSSGVVDGGQLADIQAFIDTLKPFADTYESEREPVTIALEAFNMAKKPHEALATAATDARKAVNDAYEADPNYQTAQTALEAARENVNYVDAVEAYRVNNVSENYGNLSDAKGKYAS